MKEMVLVNGQQTDSVPVSDRGLHYGDGVWETIAIKNNKPQFIDEHLARLLLGCQALSIEAPELSTLQAEINTLCSSFSALNTTDDVVINDVALKDAILKIIITRGSGGRGYHPPEKAKPSRIIGIYPWGEHIAINRQHGINLQLCNTRLAFNPQLAGFKHLNRLEQVMASAELAPEFQEGVMLDFNDFVIEGTMSNLFILNTENQIKTPLLDNKAGCGIKGIMRQKLIEWLRQENYNVLEEPLKLDEVLQAQSVLMTNSIIGIWPVTRFEHNAFQIPSFVTKFNHYLDHC